MSPTREMTASNDASSTSAPTVFSTEFRVRPRLRHQAQHQQGQPWLWPPQQRVTGNGRAHEYVGVERIHPACSGAFAPGAYPGDQLVGPRCAQPTGVSRGECRPAEGRSRTPPANVPKRNR
jgi:hypothetical protein